MTFQALLLGHFACCCFLTGLIWLIQLVHYPSFRFVNASEFSAFHRFHSFYITFIVGPAMGLELLTGILLVQKNDTPFLTLNLGLILGIWIFTFFVSVPLHNRLEKSKSADLIQWLVLSNWPRTILWSLRSGALLLSLIRL